MMPHIGQFLQELFGGLLVHFNSPSDYYWTTVNITWRTISLIQDLITPTFFSWYQYYANSE
jgi:hypothetical protein